MCYWKQWRRVRAKVRHLLALGTSKRHAILTALSSKSYWHLSKTLATQTGMTNDWLTSQGLISVRALWMRAHGYTYVIVCSSFVSRPARTRLPWWYGGWGLNTPGYPIRRYLARPPERECRATACLRGGSNPGPAQP